MLRRSLTLCAAVALCGGLCQTAFAADMATKAAPFVAAPAPVVNWTGLYIGGNAGAGFGQNDWTLNAPGIPAGPLTFPSLPMSGFLGGFQGGYNWQSPGGVWGMPVVLGIEGDFDWANLSGSGQCTLAGAFGGFNVNCNVKENWIADVTGRVGFGADKALIYVKGGVAWANNNYSGTLLPIFVGIPVTASETKVGGLLGAGVEYALTPNWSAKIEYDFIDFGSSTNTLTVGGTVISPALLNLGARETVSEVKFGINYRFWGWPATVQ